MSNHTFIFAITATSVSMLALGTLPNTSVSYSALHNVQATGTNTELHLPTAPELQVIEKETPTLTSHTAHETEHTLEPVRAVPRKESESDETVISTAKSMTQGASVTSVPFFSQFSDITAPQWKKIGCGIASLAMLIEYHKPGTLPSVDTLLTEGIKSGAYIDGVGWSYAGLIGVSKKYGLVGKAHDLAGTSMDTAFRAFTNALKEGPVMASVHYTFVPTNPIPHLVIINGIDGDTIHYNDPAEKHGNGTISTETFKAAWKKRYIEFHPAS